MNTLIYEYIYQGGDFMFNTVQLDKLAREPLYLQLANGLSYFIENGQLISGTKLPSIRSLARDLKINSDTVASAYKVLEQRGLTYGQTGRGTYVSSLPSLRPSPRPTSKAFSFNYKDLINFSSISLPDHYYPIESLKELTAEIISEDKWDCFYDYKGTKYSRLINNVCHYLEYHHIKTMPKHIGIIQGLPELIQSLPRHANKAGICIESPCKDSSIFREYGFQPFEVPLNQDGLDIEILEEHLKTGKIQYIHVTPYLQNPTGICYSEQNKAQLLKLAKAYNAYIIESDIFSDLLLDNISYCPIYSLASSPFVIYIKHFSLLYLPKLHYSFVVLPKSLSHINLKPLPYNFTDSLLSYFLDKKIWQRSKELLVNDYHKNYLRLCQLIDLHLSPYLSYTCAFGGIYIWLTLKSSHMTSQDLCDQLIANQILVSPGSLFFTDQLDHSYIRLSIAKTNLAKIEKGIKILTSILRTSI